MKNIALILLILINMCYGYSESIKCSGNQNGKEYATTVCAKRICDWHEPYLPSRTFKSIIRYNPNGQLINRKK